MVSHRSSGWFDYTEPHNHNGVKVCSVPIQLFRVVQPRRTSSNLFSAEKARWVVVGVRGGSTLPNHLITRACRCVRDLNTCSGWFNRGEHSRTLQCRENKVRRGLAQEFEVVQLYRTTYSRHLFRVVQPR